MARKRTPTSDELARIDTFLTNIEDYNGFARYSAKLLWRDLTNYFGDSWASPKLKAYVHDCVVSAGMGGVED